MAEWHDTVKARCTHKISDAPEIKVRRVYKVNRARTAPAEITCTIQLKSGKVYSMNSVTFDHHFKVI